MPNSSRQDLAELAAVLATEPFGPSRLDGISAPHFIARDAIALTRLARRATTLALRQCNEPLPEDYVDKARASIRKAAAKLLAPYGVTEFQVSGDPRGCVFQVKLQSGRSNSWGGMWAVCP